jgi:hypothetical protein
VTALAKCTEALTDLDERSKRRSIERDLGKLQRHLYALKRCIVDEALAAREGGHGCPALERLALQAAFADEQLSARLGGGRR